VSNNNFIIKKDKSVKKNYKL